MLHHRTSKLNGKLRTVKKKKRYHGSTQNAFSFYLSFLNVQHVFPMYQLLCQILELNRQKSTPGVFNTSLRKETKYNIIRTRLRAPDLEKRELPLTKESGRLQERSEHLAVKLEFGENNNKKGVLQIRNTAGAEVHTRDKACLESGRKLHGWNIK